MVLAKTGILRTVSVRQLIINKINDTDRMDRGLGRLSVDCDEDDLIICDDDDDDLNLTPSITLTKMLSCDTLDKPSQKFYTRTRQNARASPGDEDVHHRRKVESYDCNYYNQKKRRMF